MTMRFDNVSFSYRAGLPVLRDVSFEFEPGAVTAIVGPNGAGKSTLMRLAIAALAPDSGAVVLDGAPLRQIKARARARRLAYIAQQPEVAFAFTVREVISLGRHALPRSDAAIESALTAFSIESLAESPFHKLSVGQQQMTACARALAQLDAQADDLTGKILLADEPASAMDPKHALRTLELFRSLARRGLAVGVVLHDLTMGRRFADRAIALDSDGRIAATGDAASVLAPKTLGELFRVTFLEASTEAGVVLTPTLSTLPAPEEPIE